VILQLSIVDKSKLRYWLKEYTEYENEVQLHFYIQRKELCAILVLGKLSAIFFVDFKNCIIFAFGKYIKQQ